MLDLNIQMIQDVIISNYRNKAENKASLLCLVKFGTLSLMR
jgi:hypothetical protein